jgi:hypothetical protein
MPWPNIVLPTTTLPHDSVPADEPMLAPTASTPVAALIALLAVPSVSDGAVAEVDVNEYWWVFISKSTVPLLITACWLETFALRPTWYELASVNRATSAVPGTAEPLQFVATENEPPLLLIQVRSVAEADEFKVNTIPPAVMHARDRTEATDRCRLCI